MSNIQDYIKYITKKHKVLTAIPPIHVYINRINNRLVFEKNGYSQELETPETMKLFGSKKKKKRIDETKIGKKAPNLEIIKIVLVQYNLEDNQYQLKSKVNTILHQINPMVFC